MDEVGGVLEESCTRLEVIYTCTNRATVHNDAIYTLLQVTRSVLCRSKPTPDEKRTVTIIDTERHFGTRIPKVCGAVRRTSGGCLT